MNSVLANGRFTSKREVSWERLRVSQYVMRIVHGEDLEPVMCFMGKASTSWSSGDTALSVKLLYKVKDC